jgi:ParB-like chromosome segregation protein Spo0J
VDGERRFRACQSLGRPLKAWIRDITDTKEQFLESVVANFGREEHSELEVLEAITKVRKDYDLTLEKTAAVFGRSVGWVQQYMSLKKLEPKVLQMMSPELPDAQRLSFSHAILLTSLKPELQVQIASTVTKQGLKIKEVKYLVERHTGERQNRAEWSPREEYRKFQAFLQRSMVDLELFLKQPKDYFPNMFQYRVPTELEKMSGMVVSAIENLTSIKKTLDRVKMENLKKKEIIL